MSEAVSAETPESYVIIEDPDALMKAFETFRKETESIVFQRVYGDEFRGPTKKELDHFQATVEDYFQRFLKVADSIYTYVRKIDELVSANHAPAQAESVYDNADDEDGVGYCDGFACGCEGC